jgi:hypothetical protein
LTNSLSKPQILHWYKQFVKDCHVYKENSTKRASVSEEEAENINNFCTACRIFFSWGFAMDNVYVPLLLTILEELTRQITVPVQK